MKHLSQTGAANFKATISMLALAILSVVLRYVFRLYARQRLTLSDGLIGLALFLGTVYFGVTIHYIVNGPGSGTFSVEQVLANIDNGSLDWASSYLKLSYFSEIFFISSIAAVKLSILAFYHTVFGISIVFRRVNYVMVGVVGFFWLLFTFLCVFQCHPINKLWDGSAILRSDQSCMSKTELVFSFEFTNLFVDLVMLAMPPAVISQLQLPKDKKWSVCGVLLVGGIVCIVSMIRLSYIWNPNSKEFPKNISAMQITASVQLSVAILCACLPSYAPVLRLFGRKLRRSKQSDPKKVYGCKVRDENTRPAGQGHALGDLEHDSFNDDKSLISAGVI